MQDTSVREKLLGRGGGEWERKREKLKSRRESDPVENELTFNRWRESL
jgi:hypothetical protein